MGKQSIINIINWSFSIATFDYRKVHPAKKHSNMWEHDIQGILTWTNDGTSDVSIGPIDEVSCTFAGMESKNFPKSRHQPKKTWKTTIYIALYKIIEYAWPIDSRRDSWSSQVDARFRLAKADESNTSIVNHLSAGPVTGGQRVRRRVLLFWYWGGESSWKISNETSRYQTHEPWIALFLIFCQV